MTITKLPTTTSPAGTENRQEFWDEAANLLDWDTKWHTTSQIIAADPQAKRGPQISWYLGGKLNAAVNCADRHVDSGNGDKVALYFEGEPGDRIAVTYQNLQHRVSQAANALLELGITRVTAWSSTYRCSSKQL